MFIQYFAEQALLRARSEKRKRFTYKDFSNSVESSNQLQFLSRMYFYCVQQFYYY